MKIKVIEAKLYANLIQSRELGVSSFENTPQDERVVLLLDLMSSTNHRFYRGPTAAYERAEVCFNLIHNVFGYARSIIIVKELGDGILAVGTDKREALESCLLVKIIEQLVSRILPDQMFPFAVRIGIGFGRLRRLDRPKVDFLGEAIDEISKILTDRASVDSLVLSRSFFEQAKDIIADYPFLTVGELKWWKDSPEGIVHEPIDYYPLHIDLGAMSEWDNQFSSWKAAT